MNTVEYGPLRVQPAIAADADDLAPLLRPADLAELKAHPYAPEDPAKALQQAVMTSDDCFVALDNTNGKPVCLFGVNRISPLFGTIWLLGSNGLDQHKLLFLRHSRPWLEALGQQYPVLGNIVLDTNTLHINWLKWLGFTFLKHHKGLGRNGEGFYEFCKLCATH